MQIKSIITILPLIILSLASCDKDLKDEYRKCYDIKNMDNCEKSGYCKVWDRVRLLLLDNDGFVVEKQDSPILLNGADPNFESRQSTKICIPNVLFSENKSGNYEEQTRCFILKKLTPNLLLEANYSYLELDKSLLFNGWYIGEAADCEVDFDPIGYTKFKFLGSNLISRDKECDGTMLGIMESCNEFSAVTGMGDFVDGTIGCTNYRWDFSQCTVNSAGGEL